MIEAIIITINTLLAFGVVIYIINKTSKDKIEVVRELTKAILSKDLQEYVEVIPEDDGDEEVEMQDELEDVNTMDEKVLLRHLREDYEDIKD